MNKLEKLIEVLAFYADEKNYESVSRRMVCASSWHERGHGYLSNCPTCGARYGRRLVSVSEPAPIASDTGAKAREILEILRASNAADCGLGLDRVVAIKSARARAKFAVYEVHEGSPALVPHENGDRVLGQVSGDVRGDTLGAAVERFATARARVHEVHDHRRLADAFPEAPGLDVGRTGEPGGNVLLDPSGEALGVNSDPPPLGGELPDSAANEDPCSAGGDKFPEGSTSPYLAGHDDSVTQDLQAWRGRRDNRRWVQVEVTPKGEYIIETCWLPAGLKRVSDPRWERGADGRYRIQVKRDKLNLAALFYDIAYLFEEAGA